MHILGDLKEGHISWIVRAATGTNMTKRVKEGALVDLKNNTTRQTFRITKVVKGPAGDSIELINRIVLAGAAPYQIVPRQAVAGTDRVTVQSAARYINNSNVLMSHKESVAFKLEVYSGRADADSQSVAADSQASGSSPALARTLVARLGKP